MTRNELKDAVADALEGKWEAEISLDAGPSDTGTCTVEKGHIEIRGSLPGNILTYDYRLPSGPGASKIDLVETDSSGKHLPGAGMCRGTGFIRCMVIGPSL